MEQIDYNLEKWARIEITDMLFKLPFKTSLVGFSMLVDAIILSLPYSTSRLNLSKTVYSELTRKYNVNTNSIEKSIRGAISSVNDSIILAKDICYPNLIIKNALLDGKPKQFICAMSDLVNHNKLKIKSIN